MTTYTATDAGIVNRALQSFGARTTVTAAEMNALSTNEAIQANLIFTAYRDQLLRMAPWNCSVAYKNLIYLTSQPGTPENTSSATSVWTPGQPPLGYAYEYMFPEDCLRACWIIPAMQTGFAGGIPIYPTPTNVGTAPTSWQGPAIKFKVQTDQYFHEAGTTALVSGGSGYAIGDTLILGTDTINQSFNDGEVPAGIIHVTVATLSGSAIATYTKTGFGGTQVDKNAMLFSVPTYDLVQVQTSGAGTGAEISVSTIAATKFQARVILTNQEFATLAYCKQVTDPDVMDPDFIEAWAYALGAGICMALTGDKAQANMCISMTNARIAEARKADGNEGLTINDVTPDFIRIRGVNFAGYANAWNGFDWGEMWPSI